MYCAVAVGVFHLYNIYRLRLDYVLTSATYTVSYRPQLHTEARISTYHTSV